MQALRERRGTCREIGSLRPEGHGRPRAGRHVCLRGVAGGRRYMRSTCQGETWGSEANVSTVKVVSARRKLSGGSFLLASAERDRGSGQPKVVLQRARTKCRRSGNDCMRFMLETGRAKSIGKETHKVLAAPVAIEPRRGHRQQAVGLPCLTPARSIDSLVGRAPETW